MNNYVQARTNRTISTKFQSTVNIRFLCKAFRPCIRAGNQKPLLSLVFNLTGVVLSKVEIWKQD